MTKDEVSARLRALATDDKRRSETARLRDVFDDVEATLNAGVTQTDVLAELHALGFTMTMASFKSALQRIRKERAGDRPARRSAAPAPAPLRHDEETPAPEPEDASEVTSPRTMKQRGEALADQYMKPTSTNPVLKKLSKEKK